jgi:alpha-beta hydrolase superfamily lysophospholipase
VSVASRDIRGPFYFSGAGARRALFGWYSAPAREDVRGAVLLCGPIGDDTVRAHRPLRHLAERLVDAGFAVLRFDYHGTGDSDGDERLPRRVATWVEDVRAAVAELRERSGCEAVAIVGVRLGATLALEASRAGGVDRVVSWGGYTRGSAFTAAATQFYKLHKRMEPKGFSGGPAAREDGSEVFGFLLSHETIAELQALDVARPAATSDLPGLKRVLLVHDGSGRPERERLEAHLRSCDVATESCEIPGSCQFLVEVVHKSRLPEGALDAIVTWLEGDALRPAVARSAAEPTTGPFGEEAFRFGRCDALFGIYHPPHRADPERALPPIVLASAGTVHRIGPHRFYVNLARRWASLGFPVMRIDLSGIGDSPAADDGIENVTYPRDGYEDLGEALSWLVERTKRSELILAGLCSGADFAFQMAIRDPRVIGALLMNPRTFCVNDLARVETGNLESVIAAAANAVKARGDAAGEAVPVPESLRAMVERGVDTLLVVSEEDPGVHYVDVHWGEAMRALGALPGFRREDVPGADHNFTSLWSQERVSDTLAAHLTQRHSRER